MMRVSKKLLLMLLISPALAWGQEPPSCKPQRQYVAGSNVQRKVVKVRKVEGMALAAFGGNEERHEIASVSGVCLALYSVAEGRLVATAETSGSSRNSGAFELEGIAPGSYRLVTMLPPKSPFVPLDAPFKVVTWPRGGVFNRAKVYLHFRIKRLGALTYASTKRTKPNIVSTPSYSARHNKALQLTAR